MTAQGILLDGTHCTLVINLVEIVRKNASIDWTIKASVITRLRVAVKKALRKFGYLPDQERLATETVPWQAELLAEEIV